MALFQMERLQQKLREEKTRLRNFIIKQREESEKKVEADRCGSDSREADDPEGKSRHVKCDAVKEVVDRDAALRRKEEEEEEGEEEEEEDDDDDDDDMDMFACDDSSELKVKKKKKRKKSTKVAVGSSMDDYLSLADNWDDAEGYYLVNREGNHAIIIAYSLLFRLLFRPVMAKY